MGTGGWGGKGMGTLEAGSTDSAVVVSVDGHDVVGGRGGRTGRWTGHGRAHDVARVHGMMVMMMMQGRSWLWGGGCPLFEPTTIGRGDETTGSTMTGLLIEQGTDVMDEERIEQVSDLLAIGEIQGALKGNPTRGCDISTHERRHEGACGPWKSGRGGGGGGRRSPDALEMHGSNLDDVS